MYNLIVFFMLFYVTGAFYVCLVESPKFSFRFECCVEITDTNLDIIGLWPVLLSHFESIC